MCKVPKDATPLVWRIRNIIFFHTVDQHQVGHRQSVGHGVNLLLLHSRHSVRRASDVEYAPHRNFSVYHVNKMGLTSTNSSKAERQRDVFCKTTQIVVLDKRQVNEADDHWPEDEFSYEEKISDERNKTEVFVIKTRSLLQE